jgi:hypothetical protein
MGVHREEPLGNRGGMWFKDGKVLTDEFDRAESGEDLGSPSVGAKGTAGGDQPNGCGGGLATQPRRRSRGDGSEQAPFKPEGRRERESGTKEDTEVKHRTHQRIGHRRAKLVPQHGRWAPFAHRQEQL